MMSSTLVMSQSYLVVKSTNGKGVQAIGMNRDVGIRYVDSSGFQVGYLTEVGESSVIVNNIEIPLSDIDAIRVYKPLFKGLGMAQRYAAGGIIGLNVVNNAISGYRPLLSEEQAIWSVGLFATSYIWDFFSRKTYKRDSGWDFEVIQLEPIVPPSFSE